MARPKPEAPTTAQIKHDIDAGETGDKVPFIDPAAAPLGTDEEAAGSPPSSAERSQERNAQNRQPGATSPVDERGRTISGNLTTWTGLWLYIAIAVVVLLLVLIYVVLYR